MSYEPPQAIQNLSQVVASTILAQEVPQLDALARRLNTTRAGAIRCCLRMGLEMPDMVERWLESQMNAVEDVACAPLP